MNNWKRNAVVATVLLFVCAGIYLNWSYQQRAQAVDLTDTIDASALMNEGYEQTLLDALHSNGVGVVVLRGIPYWFGGDGSKAGKMREIHPRAEYEEALASAAPTR